MTPWTPRSRQWDYHHVRDVAAREPWKESIYMGIEEITGWIQAETYHCWRERRSLQLQIHEVRSSFSMVLLRIPMDSCCLWYLNTIFCASASGSYCSSNLQSAASRTSQCFWRHRLLARKMVDVIGCVNRPSSTTLHFFNSILGRAINQGV